MRFFFKNLKKEPNYSLEINHCLNLIRICFLFSHLCAIYSRDSGKNTGRIYAFAAWNTLQALAIIHKCLINSFSEIQQFMQGTKRTFERQNESIQEKRVERAPFLLFLFWKISRACSFERGYCALFKISMDNEPLTI